jgi:DNA-binding SARP family transcriptional activator
MVTGLLSTVSSSIRFRVLGPFEFYNGKRWNTIGATKQRALLSLLVLNANRVTPTQQLMSELWGERFPSSARGLLAGYVWRLRQLLGDDQAELLVTLPGGYQLALPPGASDVDNYDNLCVTGRGQLAAGDLAGAVASFSAALGLWRGSPFADIPLMPSIMAETARLDESRLAIIEARIGAEIQLGRHEGLLPELKLIVAQFPLRERLHAHLMLTLYRSGQQAEALGAYSDLRRLLVDELGIEPSKPLRDLQQRILREDPALLQVAPALPGTAAAPGLALPMPPPPRTFVGHDDELTMLVARLSAGEPVCAVHGMVGAGKTALALRAAHEVAARFPDGHLYLDLRGSAADPPLEPGEVTSRLLRACGVPEHDVPPDPRGAAARLRQLLAERRMLMVLDDALDSRQVSQVLAVPEGSAVIIAGCPAQSAVEGPNQVRLGRLTAARATELLSRCVGPERIHVEPAAASAIARLCEYLPLALRIAAVRLTLRPDWSLGGFAERLSDPRRRLDLLTCEGASIRTSLAAAARLVQRRGEPAALLALRLLGALDLPIVGIGPLAALLDLPAGHAELIATSLVSAGLLDPLGLDHYRVPDLVRLFAGDDGPPDGADTAITEAICRVVEHYASAVSEHLALLPLHQHTGQVLAWYRRERGPLCALARRDPSGNLLRVIGDLRRALPTGRCGRPRSALGTRLPAALGGLAVHRG